MTSRAIGLSWIVDLSITDSSMVYRFQALTETLNAGLVDASGLRRLNGRLTEMAAAPETEVAIEWHDASSA